MVTGINEKNKIVVGNIEVKIKILDNKLKIDNQLL
jgi:hypothetical protein